MTLPNITPYALPSLGELPASRVSWSPDPARAALLVHDMQSYFLRVYQADQQPMVTALARMQELVRACREREVPIVFSAQPADPARADRRLLEDVWGPGLTAHPDQEAIFPELTPSQSDRVLAKTRYSAFHHTELAAHLASLGRDQLWICGVYGHIGCMITAFDAFMHNVKPFLVLDAIMDFSREHHLLAAQLVAERCGRVVDSAHLLEALQQESAWFVRSTRAALAPFIDLSDVSPQSDLTELGLDSVRRMEVAERLREAGITTDVASLMECQRLEQLYQLVREAAPERAREAES